MSAPVEFRYSSANPFTRPKIHSIASGLDVCDRLDPVNLTICCLRPFGHTGPHEAHGISASYALWYENSDDL